MYASEALERADGSKGPLHPDFDVSNEVALAKAEIKKTEKHTLALSDKQKKLCKEEQEEFAKWMEQIDGNAADRAAEKAEREKAKEALSGALGDRIKQMEKFLKFLYCLTPTPIIFYIDCYKFWQIFIIFLPRPGLLFYVFIKVFKSYLSHNSLIFFNLI